LTDHYYLLGTDVSKSPSPSMFNSAFSELKIDATYYPLNVPADGLTSEFHRLGKESTRGMNITIPFKTQILSLLDELDPSSKSIGAVNVVKFSGGWSTGYNTDIHGITESLRCHGVSSVDSALLLGSGGAARAFCSAINSLGCKEISVVVRDKVRAKNFIESMRNSFPAMRFEVSENHIPKETKFDLVFNATPPNSLSSDLLLELRDVISFKTVVFEAVYYPLKTDLLRIASELGAKTIKGSEMLLNQALLAFKIWTGREPPRGIMERSLHSSLGDVAG